MTNKEDLVTKINLFKIQGPDPTEVVGYGSKNNFL